MVRGHNPPRPPLPNTGGVESSDDFLNEIGELFRDDGDDEVETPDDNVNFFVDVNDTIQVIHLVSSFSNHPWRFNTCWVSVHCPDMVSTSLRNEKFMTIMLESIVIGNTQIRITTVNYNS